MINLKQVLLEQYQKYPNMELQDALKLIYQNEFGCGHLIADEKDSYEMFLKEWEQAVGAEEEELIEAIGNGYVRVNLRAAKSQHLDPFVIHKVFVESARKQNGNRECFYTKVAIMKSRLKQVGLPYSGERIDEFIRDWEENGCDLFRHSAGYRRVYRPAYRVVLAQYSRLLPLLSVINELKGKKGHITVGIEGRCGAGKTTLSGWLAQFLDAQVIHMDDFFLPPSLRTESRLGEPGGNIHYERFKEEVIKGILSNQPYDYHIFDCSVMDYIRTVRMPKNKITVIEGAYAMHPRFGEIYDYKVFCDIKKEKQTERIMKRNGLENYKQFEERFIPMEELYFHTFKVRKYCDLIIYL